MYKRTIFFGLVSLLFLIPLTSNATWLRLEPGSQTYDYGDTIKVDLYADIDESDAIFGFGFDLSFDNGTSNVSLGDAGDYLTFTDFEVNDVLFSHDPLFPPLWEDGDTISGELPIPIDPLAPMPEFVWGTNTLLGTFSFTAPTVGVLGTETISLYPLAGDYGWLGDEGLLGVTALMPNSPTATMAPIPEPSTMVLFGTGLITLLGVRRKARK